MEFYAAERKKKLIPFATAWMELESIVLSEISQVVKEKYHMISPINEFYFKGSGKSLKCFKKDSILLDFKKDVSSCCTETRL